MTILQALNRYYERMVKSGEVEAPGFSREKISFVIVLSDEGEAVAVVDLRQTDGKKSVPPIVGVPSAVLRTAGVLPNRFWDRSSYVLGRTAGAGRRTIEEHAAFRAFHRDLLAGSHDKGLIALARFVDRWVPSLFNEAPFTPEMLDANFIFRLAGDVGYIHEREAAQRLFNVAESSGNAGFCLITGVEAPLRRLHPLVKGVRGSQSSGAALISFNLDAFTSYGKEQGANAPISELAAFRYSAALNRMLADGSRNRLTRPVADTTIIFWADAPEESTVAAAEVLFASWFDPPLARGGEEYRVNDGRKAAKLRDQMENAADAMPRIALSENGGDVRFYILGLAPNAARISIRYWLDTHFSVLARRLLDHALDMRVVPVPLGWGQLAPSISLLLVKTTAHQEKVENIPTLLAGEAVRAVLFGSRYPRTWLAAAIIRLRSGDNPGGGWHAAVIRGVLERERRLTSSDDKGKQEVSVGLNREDRDPAYLLGRLFALLEAAQRLALPKVKATIRNHYIGVASAAPARIFPILLRAAQSHLSVLLKTGKGEWINEEVERITGIVGDIFPESMKLEAQGRFFLGYYHQRQADLPGRSLDLKIVSVAEIMADEEAKKSD